MRVPEGVEGWEDMGRKAQWFHGTGRVRSLAELTRLRDDALAHTEVMRELARAGSDPGGGAPKTAVSIVGGGRRATARRTERPGEVPAEAFLTDAVEITVPEGVAPAVKLRPRRGARSTLDPRTARLFRWDPQTRRWTLVVGSGWNERSGYAYGPVTRSGTYAAVALPKDGATLERIALMGFTRRYVASAVASGAFAAPADFRDAAAFGAYYATTPAAAHEQGASLAVAQRARARAVRVLGRSLGDLTVDRPEWSIIDLLPTLADRWAVTIVGQVPYWPYFDRVNDVVGPWFPMGPFNINGRCKSIAMHPTNGNILYAGAANGGVWRSTDGGQVWQSSWVFEASLAVGALAVAPSVPTTVYAATGEDTDIWGPSYGGAGVFRSTDSGLTWSQRAGSANVGGRCNRIVVHPSNRHRLLVSSDTGVHRSTDGGSTWTTVLGGHATDLVMAADRPDILYAGVRNDGIYKSTDGGTTWTKLTGQLVTIAIIINKSEPFPTGNDLGWVKLAIGRGGPKGSDYLIAKFGPNSARTAATEDGGGVWLALAGNEGVTYDEWCSFVAIHPRSPQVSFIGGLNLQRTTNGFMYAATSGTHSDHHAMVFHPTNDNIAYVCTDGGVYRSTDAGATWTLSSRYLQAAQLMSLGVSRAGDTVVGSATQDQGIVATDGSMEWRDTGGGNEWGMFVIDPSSSANVFCSPGDGQLRRSTDHGHTWSNPSNGLTEWWAAKNRSTRPATFQHAAVKPGDSTVVVGATTVEDQIKDANGNVTASYGPNHGIFYSSNSGVSWSKMATLTERATRVSFSESTPARVYVATQNGRVYRSDSSGGSGWSEPYTVANRPPSNSVTSLSVDPHNKNRVYLAYLDATPNLWRTTDAGATWRACSGVGDTTSLPAIALRDVWVDPENSDCLWVASDIGVFRSNDYGASWYPANDGLGGYDLPRVPVSGLAYQPSSRRLYAATVGRGAYYTLPSGLVRLRAVARCMTYHGRVQRGIVRLRLTDGAKTYDMTRQEVIRRIQAGTEVYVRAADGTTAEVQAMQPDHTVHPMEYLKTIPDSTPGDNLLSLPLYYA